MAISWAKVKVVFEEIKERGCIFLHIRFFVNFGEKLFIPNFKKTFMIQNVAQWEELWHNNILNRTIFFIPKSLSPKLTKNQLLSNYPVLSFKSWNATPIKLLWNTPFPLIRMVILPFVKSFVSNQTKPSSLYLASCMKLLPF